MLKTIRIRNFKCFRDTGPTDLKPVTLLFGKNGSGKTSFLDAVYLLKQTLEDPDISSPIVGDGNTFKFGHYSDYVYRHDVHREIEMSFRFSLEEPVSEELDLGEKRKRPGKLTIQGDEVTFSLALRYNRKAGRVQVAQMQIGDAKRRFVDVQYDARRKVSSLQSDLLRDKGRSRAQKLLKHEDLYHFLPPGDLYYRMTSRDRKTMYMWQWVSHVAVAAQMIHSGFSNITYLGPLRDYPERTYVRGGGEPVSVGYKGSQALPLVYLRCKKRDKLGQDLDSWLRLANLCQNLIFAPEGRTHFRPKIIGVYKEEDDLPDTGFGISQVLPVAVALLSANKGSVVCLEQPELHLHPFAATRLADLFSMGAKRGVTSIVETHSEHLLIRMQRLVAEGKVTPDQVAIYSFEKGPEGPTLRAMSIRRDGALENAPDGFFSEDYQELVEMQRSVAKGNRRT